MKIKDQMALAKAQGKDTFIADRTCKYGHTERSSSTGSCVECTNRFARAKYAQRIVTTRGRAPSPRLNLGKLAREAAAKGHTLFNVGVSCRNGHTCGRRVADKKCVDCAIIQTAKIRANRTAKNRAHAAAYAREYRKKHPESTHFFVRRWQKANPEKMLAIRLRAKERASKRHDGGVS